MRWFPTSLTGTPLGRAAATTLPRQGERTESIRAALIDTLADSASQRAHSLRLRIRYAGDPQLLWYLRPEVMSVLATQHGEAHARVVLSRISPLFRDVLPDGLASRLGGGEAGSSAPHGAA